MKTLEVATRALRASGRKSLVPYFMAGLTPDWTDYVAAAAQAGADLIEIGLPFSDPMMDGVVIQEAASRSLANGTTIDTVLRDLRAADVGVPLVAMTYYNVFHHYGLERAVGALRDAGVVGTIIPDLALEEATPWQVLADDKDLATVYLVAPSTPPSRVSRIVDASQGFVYAAARMSVTGISGSRERGGDVVAMIREASDLPAYIGIGVSSPTDAQLATRTADGVIVGSTLVRMITDGVSPFQLEAEIAKFRRAIDD